MGFHLRCIQGFNKSQVNNKGTTDFPKMYSTKVKQNNDGIPTRYDLSKKRTNLRWLTEDGGNGVTIATSQ